MKPKLIIPENFILVCKKMYPEIKDITFVDFQIRSNINPYDYSLPSHLENKFHVAVDIHFVQGFQPKGLKEYYTVNLNKFFQFTYGVHNINIIVEDMFVTPEKTEQEIFFEIFRPSF